MITDKIDKQVKEEPLTKEECRTQFIEKTEELGLKHSFDFDEAWEIGQEIRRRNKFRDNIVTLENQITDIEGALVGKELHDTNPVKHTFADGCYVREIFNPAGLLLVTKIHKKKHPFFLMKGKMSILTEEGVKHVEAPHHGITNPGTKRVIYTHTDCVFITVHATESTNIEEIEKSVIAKDFQDPEITLEDINILRNSGIDLKIENEEYINKNK
tara:strand:- start:1149 stop:1790 length:642 start_codon:yes stop_codon:yes gene_type:complete